jgi:anti-sigma regulatory factor (Ser/Thr protein kinase)
VTFAPIAHTGAPGYVHDALLFGSDQELLDVAVPFLLEGCASGEPTLVGMDPARTALIQAAVGDATDIAFVPAQYVRPATTTVAWTTTFQRHVAEGATCIRVLGAPPHTKSGPSWDPWARYEAAINHVFADLPVWGLCAYDTRTADDAVLDDVARTHPRLATAAGIRPNPRYQDPATFLAARPADPSHLTPDRPAPIAQVNPTIRAARAAGETAATAAGLDDLARQDLAVALSELTANAECHGRPPVTVELWPDEGRVVAAVSDDGTGPEDPFIGLVPVEPTAVGGRGLWITHQVCDEVVLSTDGHGFTVRLAIDRR